MTILCEPDARLAATIAESLDGAVRVVADLDGVAAALDANPDETLLVVGPGLDVGLALPFAATRRRANPALGVILLHDHPSAVLARAAQAGISHVLGPTDRDGLAAASAPFVAPAASAATVRPGGPTGQVVTVFAAKDGCGKTTFATNLATALSAGGTRRVCLLDLDLEFGDVSTVLGVKPKHNLAGVQFLPQRIDGAGVARLVTRLHPGLDAILAPSVAGQAAKMPVPLVEGLLDALPTCYDHVVVDTPAQFSAHVLAALDRSDRRVLITSAEFPALRSLRRLLDTFDLLAYERWTRSLVVNRAGLDGALARADVEKVLKDRPDCWVPASADVPASINRGVPLVASQPEHPVSAAVRRFAAVHLLTARPGRVRPSGPA